MSRRRVRLWCVRANQTKTLHKGGDFQNERGRRARKSLAQVRYLPLFSQSSYIRTSLRMLYLLLFSESTLLRTTHIVLKTNLVYESTMGESTKELVKQYSTAYLRYIYDTIYYIYTPLRDINIYNHVGFCIGNKIFVDDSRCNHLSRGYMFIDLFLIISV